MQQKYLFAVKDKLQTSCKGNRELVALNNSAVKQFFTASNASALYTLLQQVTMQYEHYLQSFSKDSAAENAYLRDECYSQVQQDSAPSKPCEADFLKMLTPLFPNPELQKTILASKNSTLRRTLRWWLQRISSVWQMVFHRQPDIFCPELKAEA